MRYIIYQNILLKENSVLGMFPSCGKCVSACVCLLIQNISEKTEKQRLTVTAPGEGNWGRKENFQCIIFFVWFECLPPHTCLLFQLKTQMIPYFKLLAHMINSFASLYSPQCLINCLDHSTCFKQTNKHWLRTQGPQ